MSSSYEPFAGYMWWKYTSHSWLKLLFTSCDFCWTLILNFTTVKFNNLFLFILCPVYSLHSPKSFVMLSSFCVSYIIKKYLKLMVFLWVGEQFHHFTNWFNKIYWKCLNFSYCSTMLVLHKLSAHRWLALF